MPDTAQPLTPKDELLIRTAAHNVWDRIAYDCLVEVPDQTLDRDTVIELVLDADRLYCELECLAAPPHVLALIEGRTNPQRVRRDALMRSFVFRYARYGM